MAWRNDCKKVDFIEQWDTLGKWDEKKSGEAKGMKKSTAGEPLAMQSVIGSAILPLEDLVTTLSAIDLPNQNIDAATSLQLAMAEEFDTTQTPKQYSMCEKGKGKAVHIEKEEDNEHITAEETVDEQNKLGPSLSNKKAPKHPGYQH